MPVAYRDFEIPGNATFMFVVDVIGGPDDLIGYTGAMSIRELRTDVELLADLSPSWITVNPSTRQVTVRIPAEETATYAWKRGVYDLLITSSDGVDSWRLVEGRVTCSQAVTEPI